MKEGAGQVSLGIKRGEQKGIGVVLLIGDVAMIGRQIGTGIVTGRRKMDTWIRDRESGTGKMKMTGRKKDHQNLEAKAVLWKMKINDLDQRKWIMARGGGCNLN
jgi:hypothetical protein